MRVRVRVHVRVRVRVYVCARAWASARVRADGEGWAYEVALSRGVRVSILARLSVRERELRFACVFA